MSEDPDGADPKPSRQVGRLEWAVGALGAAIVIGVLGALIYEAATGDDGEPALIAHVLSVTPTAGGFVVRFRAENQGPTTAAEVTFAATLKEGGRTLEEAEVTLDYVARKSSREAAVIFRSDPRAATLDLAATSFRRP